VSTAQRADILIIVGATGSGKSLQVKAQLAKRRPKRLLIWDPQAEYGQLASSVPTIAAAVEQVRLADTRGGLSLVFVPSPDPKLAWRQFDLWCQLAFQAGRCTLLAEELSGVTRPGSSPPGWLRVITQGRHRALSVIGTTQRPALVDKTALDNATTVRCGRLNSAASRRYMADLLDVPADQLAQLQALEWVEKDLHTGRLRRYTVAPPR
jgi:DNA helicase HerA-like ATPase